jgi:hypothetical protein
MLYVATQAANIRGIMCARAFHGRPCISGIALLGGGSRKFIRRLVRPGGSQHRY